MPLLLVVVAHPDDETFGCGSLLLHAAAAGMATAVLCATRGEAGERVDPDRPAHVNAAAAPGELGAIREAETRAAGAILGVGRVDFLGYHDSGMDGAADSATLVGAPLAEVSERVGEHIDRLRPSIVVTLDGSDGHRDHVRIRDATLAAVDSADFPVDCVYLHCLPQSLMRQWIEHMAATDPSWEQLRANPPGTPDEAITTVIDTAAHLTDREQAMRAHVSQRSPYDGLPDGLRRAFLITERLRRVRPPWRGGQLETSLLTPTAIPTIESEARHVRHDD